MGNTNKSKIPYSAMVSEVEMWSGIHILDRIKTTKSSSVILTGSLHGKPSHNNSF